MERRVSLRPPRRLRLRMLVALAFALGAAGPAHAEDRLMLVVARQSPITALSAKDLHKLYLGLPVTENGKRVRPLRNDADELMHQVFFQSIVSMAEPAYDRRMLSQALQQGAVPPVLGSTRAVFDMLAADPLAVSYAWAVDIEKDPRVRAIRLLWRR